MARQTSKGSLRQKSKYVLSASASTAALIVSLLGSPGVVNGQSTTFWSPVKTTCNLRFGQGTVVGNKMFVDGGEQVDQQNYLNEANKLHPRSDNFWWQNKHLWELDLSAKFYTSKPPWTANPKPDDWNRHYNGAQGALWNLGGGTFYTFGGWMSNIYEGPPPGHRIVDPYYTPVKAANGSITYTYQLPPPSIHVYDTAAANWASISLPSNMHRLSNMGYTQSKRNKIGYMLGGFPVVKQQNGGTNQSFVARLVDEGVWKNTLSAYDFRKNTFNTSDLPNDIGATSSVVLHTLEEVGDEGVLVALAGKSNNTSQVDFRPMDEIWIYDIASSYWMKQTATGDIPSVRTRSCSVLVPAPDFSSYQLYMFSGSTGWDAVYVLDMYVLSIPAFVWKKIHPKNYPNEWGIVDMACGLYEDRQFIIVPGQVNVSTSATEGVFSTCNIGTAVHVFDTSTWTFQAEFDPDNKESFVPLPLLGLLGGGTTGGAFLHEPEGGWNDQQLGRVFRIRNQLPDRRDLSRSRSYTEIIAGIVSGFVVLGFLIGLVFWVNKRQGAKQTAVPERGAKETPTALPGRSAKDAPTALPGRGATGAPTALPGRGAKGAPTAVPERGAKEASTALSERCAKEAPTALPELAAKGAPTVLSELGAIGAPLHYHSPHNTPTKKSEGKKMPPPELQAYEPPEMGGTTQGGRRMDRRQPHEGASGAGDTGQGAVPGGYGDGRRRRGILPELGAKEAPSHYYSPHNTPTRPCMPPHELQAYEPPEMGGSIRGDRGMDKRQPHLGASGAGDADQGAVPGGYGSGRRHRGTLSELGATVAASHYYSPHNTPTRPCLPPHELQAYELPEIGGTTRGGRGMNRWVPHSRASGAGDMDQGAVPRNYGDDPRCRGALPELGATGAPSHYHSPHNTPARPCMAPHGLQAYEPPEMGETTWGARGRGMDRRQPHSGASGAGDTDQRAVTGDYGNVRRRRGALPELGAIGAPSHYHSPHNIPTEPCMPPYELQAYEPPEMGGSTRGGRGMDRWQPHEEASGGSDTD